MITAIDQYVIDAIRKERKAQKVSQSMLAFGIGISKGFISQAESPKCDVKYSLRHINDIAKYLGCSPRDFLPKEPFEASNKKPL